MESLHLSFQRVVDEGTKVGGSMSRYHAWEEVIDKVSSRLSRWKMKTLSIGECSSLWTRVMKAIHGEDGKIGINFFDFMRLKLGNGNNISFWNDKWIDDNTLQNLFPRIYALENNKQVSISMKLADLSMADSLRRNRGVVLKKPVYRSS
ncbi:hypothetical protein Tco_1216632 [Tanacetum coccineum]